MIIEGINAVKEVINSNNKINKIIYNHKREDVINLVNLAIKKGIYVEEIKENLPQGIAADVPNFKYCELEDILSYANQKGEAPFILILDGIQDPHNLGAIIRTAECAGVHGIIIPTNRAIDVNATVYKTSAGAVSYMKICKVVNITRTINQLKELGVWVYALEADGKNMYQEDFNYPTALVVGSEGKGVSHLVKQSADVVISIDMFGKVNSLNASNAAAIAIYEVVRQRRKG